MVNKLYSQPPPPSTLQTIPYKNLYDQYTTSPHSLSKRNPHQTLVQKIILSSHPQKTKRVNKQEPKPPNAKESSNVPSFHANRGYLAHLKRRIKGISSVARKQVSKVVQNDRPKKTNSSVFYPCLIASVSRSVCMLTRSCVSGGRVIMYVEVEVAIAKEVFLFFRAGVVSCVSRC